MKNITKRLFSLVLATVMMAGFALTSSAAGIVTYEGDAQEFIFAPGTEYSLTDLFTDFKNVMPGDTISQTVRLVNNGKGGTTTRFYMKALGPAAADDKDLVYNEDKLGNGNEGDGYTDKPLNNEVLKQLNLTVKLVKGDKTLFDAPADQTAGLTDWVHLGDLRKGGEIDLEVTLEVPIEMGNEFQDVAGALDWAFKIEEIPDPAVPDTGDNTNVMLYGGMFGVAAMALIVLIVLKKKTKEEQ
ncbi:MAG: LPXTG cell wall anchor domain-containing protein [Oscillospiraceae bacterium]|nr:LPXTG cell wall anchor domain-containing protein [Oscillospiraceae bacterium]